MNRRQLLATLGALSAGGAATVGTGALSSASADRGFQVNVSGDASAALGVAPHSGPNGAYADTTNGGEFRVNLSPDNKNVGGKVAGGEGVNPDSVTVIDDVFEIANNATQQMAVEVSPLLFIRTGADDSLLVLVVPLDSSFTLDVGESMAFGLVVVSLESAPVDTAVEGTLDIVAEAT